MAKIPVSATDSAYIAERIRAFPTEAPRHLAWLAGYVAEFAALPLYLGWFETTGIRSDGTVICWSTEGEYDGYKEVDDVVLVRLSLVEGAKKYPGLKGLIPSRPANARTCEQCRGLGYFPQLPAIICACGGVGWVDAESER